MRLASVLPLALAAVAAAQAPKDHWPRFRGPDGSAAIAASTVPTEWTAGSVAWKTDVGGKGHSSPVVWGDSVFVTTATEGGTHRELVCVGLADGAVRWRQGPTLPTYKMHQKNSFATSTPATDGQRVVCVFSSGASYLVLAYDFAGKALWQVDLGRYESNHGAGASPVIAGGKVIVCNDQDGPSFVVALDAATGAEVWRTPRRTEKTAFSTPLVIDAPTGRQVVCSSMMGLTGLDLDTGATVWTCDLFEDRAVGSPFATAGMVFGICGSGRKGSKLIAVRPTGTGDVSRSHLAWETGRMLPYCPTPVGRGERLFLVTEGGVIRCLDATDGNDLWTDRLAGNFSSSPVLAGDRLFVAGEEGTVFVVAATDDRFELLAENALDDVFLSTPAVTPDRMLLRGERLLWCVAGP